MKKLLRVVAHYERGWVTEAEAATKIIEETTEAPTAEFVVRVPPAILDEIRAITATPQSWDYVVLGLGECDVETATRAYRKIWRAGLAIWRQHFGIVMEGQV